MKTEEIMAEFRAKIGTVYEIGPGRKYENINDVPWESLQPGDTVNIHWREAPYNERFLIAAQGNRELPIIIHGVAGPNGQLPLIDGNGAVTRTAVPTGDTNVQRWVVKIGGPGWDKKYKFISRYITVENLEITGGKLGNSYTEWDGTRSDYLRNAAGIWLDRGEHIIIRNCKIHGCCNGLFVNSRNNAEGFFVSRDILVEGNYFYGNGLAGNILCHNSYCAAIGITYQYNHYGPLCSEAYGYGLKDRSSGAVIRYNWIEGGRRQISLDDGEDNPLIPLDPAYNDTYVYGNLLVENDDGPIRVWGNDEIIHFGGDNLEVPDRSGTLYFYNNTVITYRNKKTYDKNSLDLERAYKLSEKETGWTTLGREERTTLFLLPSGQHVDAQNNIFYAAGSDPAPLSILNGSGTVHLSHNWLSTGWVKTMDPGWDDSNIDRSYGQTVIEENTITGNDPGFINIAARDFRLAPESKCRNAGADINSIESLNGFKILEEYSLHQSGKKRPQETIRNLGAFGL